MHRQGATLDEITLEVRAAQKEYDEERAHIDAMMQFNRAVSSGLEQRFSKWRRFQRNIAIRTKHQFQYHLFNRGFYGKIVFDHKTARLSLRVQTEEAQTQAQESGKMKDKDPKSLSGGEKSFSTICLLLAMWESIGSPIRCLDEYDVFMDTVNRRISSKMIVCLFLPALRRDGRLMVYADRHGQF